MKKIDSFEAKLISMKELIIGRINCDCSRLIT